MVAPEEKPDEEEEDIDEPIEPDELEGTPVGGQTRVDLATLAFSRVL